MGGPRGSLGFGGHSALTLGQSSFSGAHTRPVQLRNPTKQGANQQFLFGVLALNLALAELDS